MRPLRITCFIDYLGSGGAQRQLCTLAVLLKRQGADVSILTYHKNEFFLPMLEREGISSQCISHKSRIKRILEVRRALRNGKQDVVLAFLPGPCMYAELAALPKRKWGLVVSERSAVPGSHLAKFPLGRYLHRVADYVCTNSHTNRLMIEKSVPKLTGRVVTIYNMVDLNTFKPCMISSNSRSARPIKIVVAASHQRNKNLIGLIEAMAIARGKMPDINVQICWYGDIAPDPSDYNNAVQLIQKKSLSDCIKLYPAVDKIAEVYNSADAVALFSFYEGLPNAVCEAMSCGRPILMSNISDAGNLVKTGHNGLLFDPASSENIADTLIAFCTLSQVERDNMGENSRKFAEHMFNPVEITSRYLQLLEAAACRNKIMPMHWVPDVPDSALHALRSTES